MAASALPSVGDEMNPLIFLCETSSLLYAKLF